MASLVVICGVGVLGKAVENCIGAGRVLVRQSKVATEAADDHEMWKHCPVGQTIALAVAGAFGSEIGCGMLPQWHCGSSAFQVVIRHVAGVT